jgi:pimeloyl-ACP methyl ester carboxylesterase
VPDVDVRFAHHQGKAIAYTVFGAGPFDMLFGNNWCPIDLMWELPQLASFMDHLGHMTRVIVFDALGGGASDSLLDAGAASSETYGDVTLAVLDAARAPRVVLFDATGGGASLTFAATYPQRVQSLILANLRPSYPEVRRMSPDGTTRSSPRSPT